MTYMLRPPLHARPGPIRTDSRPSASRRGYGSRWQRVRLTVLREEPLCRECQAEGRTTPAAELDHADGDVANLDRSNLVPLCKRHHSQKTVRQDGGFGRRADRPA